MLYKSELTALAVPFRVDHRHAFVGGLVEVRRYFWSAPLEQRVHALSDSLVINMAITSRPAHTRVDRIAPGSDPLSSEAGRILVMIPGMPYRLAAPSGSFRSLHCAIACEKFEVISGEKIDWRALGSLGGELRNGLGIDSHLLRIHDELVRSRMGWEAVIEACVEVIAVELTRKFRRGRPARPEVYAGGLPAWRLRLILDRVRADKPAPRLTELAELCGLTERQLSRAFKAETGLTIGRFVDEATMERAFRLLTTTSLSIAHIAHQLGFASADSFAQSYRRLTGYAPSKNRQG